MPPIKIISEPEGVTRIWINGVEVDDVVSVDIHAEQGEPIRVGVDMYASESFELFMEDATVIVGLRIPVGFVLRSQRMADGSMRFWCEQQEPVTTH
jgi:hypothetical protein